MWSLFLFGVSVPWTDGGGRHLTLKHAPPPGLTGQAVAVAGGGDQPLQQVVALLLLEGFDDVSHLLCAVAMRD